VLLTKTFADVSWTVLFKERMLLEVQYSNSNKHTHKRKHAVKIFLCSFDFFFLWPVYVIGIMLLTELV
jgi:hypothetical protein